MQNSYSNQKVEYAGFWVRLAAYVIDSLIVFFALLIVRLFLSGLLSVLSGTWIGGNILFHYTLKDIVLYVFQVLYFILCTYLTGTTLGKRAMNLRVVSAEEGQRLSLLDVAYRETVGRFLCGLSVGIGYIIAGVDREKRGLHDILCDTRVVYAKKIRVIPVYPRYQMPPVSPQNMNMQTPPVSPQNMPPVPPQNMQTPPGPQPWQQNTAPVQPEQKEEEIEVQENRRDS